MNLPLFIYLLIPPKEMEANQLFQRVKDKKKLLKLGMTQSEIDELYGADQEN